MPARQLQLGYLFILINPCLLAEPRWIRMKSPNFEVYSGDSERGTRETVRQFEQVRSFFMQMLGKSDITPLPVLLADGQSLTFSIDDPAKVTVVGKDGGVVDLACGKQNASPVRIEYEVPGSGAPGIDGLVRLIQFQ